MEHEQYNIGVKALIINRERVLLLKRSDHPVWEFPGGRINKGETIREALLRELVEELPRASEITIHDIVYADQADYVLPSGNRLMLLCFKVTSKLPSKLFTSNEHEQARWATINELQELPMQPIFKKAALLSLSNETPFLRC